MGLTKPVGNITTSYGTFGTATGSVDLGYGGQNWGNFFELDGLNTGRFLDPPEFKVFHAKGNEQNVFDRVDYQFSAADSIHTNFNYSRSWFQNPNTYDNLNVTNVVSGGTGASPVFGIVGNTDQRSKIGTYNIAPTYTHILSKNAVLNVGGFVRRDGYNYYPSNNPLADLGPIQNESISQQRSLLNAGAHAELTIQKGINSIKAGTVYQHTFLREHDNLGMVNATFNSPCVDANGNPQPGFTDPAQCAAAGLVSNDPSAGGSFNSVLLPYDLTRSGSLYALLRPCRYQGTGPVRSGPDQGRKLGLQPRHPRGSLQRADGHASGRNRAWAPHTTSSRPTRFCGSPMREPSRLRLTRTWCSPAQGCLNDVLAPLLACTPGVTGTLQPGFRNEFHAGLQQAFGKNFVISGDYIWKYTHNAFDFSIFGNTPIFFPIDWHNSKIPGFALRADVPNYHHLSAFVVMSSVAARFFPPQSRRGGRNGGTTRAPVPHRS